MTCSFCFPLLTHVVSLIIIFNGASSAPLSSSSSSSSSPSVSEVGYIFEGCYYDSLVSADLNAYSSVIAEPDPRICCQKCRKVGRPYCGLQRGTYCFCGDRYGSYGLSTECSNNPSCQSLVCGGDSSNSIYYSLGTSNVYEPDNATFVKKAETFWNARIKCMEMNGDVMSPNDDVRMDTMVTAVGGNGGGGGGGVVGGKIWVGLFRLLDGQPYQWTEELTGLFYARNQLNYYNQWQPFDDQSRDCVVMDTTTRIWASVDCESVEYPFVCAIYKSEDKGVQANDTTNNNGTSLTASNAVDDYLNRNKMMLYIVVPIFLIIYTSSCIAYCIYRLWIGCGRKPLLEKIKLMQWENECTEKAPTNPVKNDIVGVHGSVNREGQTFKGKIPSDPPSKLVVPCNSDSSSVLCSTNSDDTQPAAVDQENVQKDTSSINEILMKKLKAKKEAQERNRKLFNIN